MKSITTKRIAATAAAIAAPLGTALILGTWTAPTASAAGESAVATIGLLEAQGFDVKIDRVGSAPLDRCVVTDVRNPHERTEIVRVGGRDDRDFIPVVVRRTVSVSLDCSR
ncbi:hypothetical protein [Mycolicibacterium cosmeticum]|uniref:hypothetical protein n=1 Tax=Mycolicibacterium cosmeticum TaxID=258533 RepID=UPI003204B68A